MHYISELYPSIIYSYLYRSNAMDSQQTSYANSLPSADQFRYLEKLKLIGNVGCPFTLESGLWANNPNEWPQVDYGDIWNYLIESPGKYIGFSTLFHPNLPNIY